MNPESFQLSLEQEFELARISQELEGVDRDRVIKLLLQTAAALMVKDNIIRNLIKDIHANFGALP